MENKIYKQDNNKIEIIQTKKHETKIALGLCWATVSRHGAYPSMCETPPEKNEFILCKRSQLQKTWLGVGAHVHIPLAALGPHLAWTSASPVRGATVCRFLCVWKTWFPCEPASPLDILSSNPLLCTAPHEDILVRTERSEVSHSLRIVQ